MKLKKALLASLFTFSLILAGCGNTETAKKVDEEKVDKAEDQLTVLTTIFPLEDFTKKIGGNYVDVKSIYPPNVDAHSFEPSTKDMIALADSDLFIYTGVGIEGFADKATESLKNEKVTILKAGEGIDLLKSTHEHEHSHEEDGHNHDESEHSHDKDGHEVESTEEHHEHEDEDHDHHHGDFDPHVWLDPILSIELATNIKNSLIQLMPQHRAAFETNFEQLKDNLEELDEEFKSTIEHSKTKYLLVSHAAYGYWEERYGIEQIATAGLSPTQEPTQKGLQSIIEESKEHQIQYVIFEQNLSTKVAEIIQKEIGAESLILHNLEAITDENLKQDDDYFSIMRRNLETIKTALND
ncbi:zinc transport system substrate-binding protein [Cytobacillus eiseniae]|uniref:Zinc transport system substrate-binding protein n=1 Tax=Cytobacillus eiseniae TaxID=762947 RepID=A0ABS4RIK7_9BACI|nr:zinc ABC transporter substrate-binding protein [Cytobacillus eiseniae]MBP2242743.1 zinc transport system substrate-binding protein [Cytobacillus eiseniae]